MTIPNGSAVIGGAGFTIDIVCESCGNRISGAISGIAIKAEGPPPPKLYKIEKVCQMLQIGRSALYLALQQGKVRSTKFGTSVRISQAEVDRLSRDGWPDATDAQGKK